MSLELYDNFGNYLNGMKTHESLIPNQVLEEIGPVAITRITEPATIDGTVITGLGTGSEIAIQGWQHDLVFSSSNYTTVAWASGTITLLDGTTYSIDAGNTGAMSATTYIYLDIGTSETVLQTTTTASTAVGTGKILVATAKNSSYSGRNAFFQVFGGNALGGFGAEVTASDVRPNTLTGNEIANLAISSAELAANAVQEAKIAADAVTATKIAVSGLDGTSGDVAANHIVAGMIQTDAITAVKIQADAVTAPKINVVGLDGTTGRIVVADATDADVVTGGINTYATTLIQAGKILISGVTALSDWSHASDATLIDGGDIYTNSITATQIAAGTITATEIATGTITANEIATNTITASEIFGGTITATEIAATTITADRLNISQISDINVDLGTVTAGTIATGVDIVSTDAAILEERVNTVWNRSAFIGNSNDGLTEAPGAGGSISRKLLITILSSVGADCILSSAQSGFTAANDHEVSFSAKLSAITNQDVFMGLFDGAGPIPTNSTSTTRHFGFMIEDGTLYSSNANNVTQTKTEITGITLTDFNIYRIVLDAGTDIKFYINDILKTTHTTNLPGVGMDINLYFGITQQVVGTKTLTINNNYLLIKK